MIEEAYDALGRRTSLAAEIDGTDDLVNNFTYDYYNRMPQVTVDESGTFIYDGNHILLQLDDSGDVEHRLMWGPSVDHLLTDENTSGDVLWALPEHVHLLVGPNTPSATVSKPLAWPKRQSSVEIKQLLL